MFTRHFGTIAVGTMLALFAASLLLSPGFTFNSFYVIPIMLAIWTPNPGSAFGLAGLATVLIGVHTAIMPTVGSMSATLFNRTSYTVSLWLVAAVIVRYRHNESQRRAEATARLQAEQALRRADKKLEDIRYALDQSAIVATTDVSGAITYVNDNFLTTSKYSREELMGRSLRLLDSGLHTPEFYEEMYGTISAGRVWRGELRNRAKDGTVFWQDTTIVPFLDDRGQPYQYISIQYDITERKRSEAALRDQDALARLGKMAAVVAHEVRNPLAGIRGAVEVMGRRLAMAGFDQGIVKEIVARIDTLNDIVNDLLLFAKPNQPVLGRVRLCDVLADTVGLFRQDPSFTEITVAVEPTDIVVNADAGQLKLMLFNLLLNGAQAMDGRGAMTVSTHTNGHVHEIRITDEGPGIQPEIREHLFEPFFTTRHQGTGLGLVTARRILEAHGGHIDLECPPAGGTVAVVRIPAA